MESKIFENSFESNKISPINAPAVESFSDPAKAKEVWPEHITNNEEFLNQLEERKELNKRLDAVISNLPQPDMPFQEAISQEHLTEEQVADMYTSLTTLLENNPDYDRIVLYIPFEFLPNADWQPSSEALQEVAEQFKTAYMKAWNNLLVVHDVRANFVDGDVLEVESRTEDLPRVVKAAHLIPKLVENGMMETDEVLKLMEESDDKTLKCSIADTLPVLADLGLIKEAELERMKISNDQLLQDAARLINSSTEKTEEKIKAKEITPSSLQEKLDDNFADIDAETYTDITDKRIAWLKQEKKQRAIESAGDDISNAITSDRLSQEMDVQLNTAEVNPASQRAMIDGIHKAIESIANTDITQAQKLYTKYSETLTSLWSNDNPEIHNALSKTFYRLHNLEVINNEQFNDLDLKIPNLAGPFYENLKTMDKEIKEVREIITSIESDPELSQYIYPVALIFGSKIKGYGMKDADIDVGVFVKPGQASAGLETVRSSLKKIFDHEKIQGEIIEFHLKETEDGLSVDDSKGSGISSSNHTLFGAAWEGNQNEIKELREKLLTPYLYDEEKTIDDRDARGVYLEELERDTLQYRLMHKGYERFLPSRGGIDTPHADKIDGQSTFWDSGYRQMATKLFANRVFLPKISK